MLRIEEIRHLAIAAGQLGEDIGRVAARRLAITEPFAADGAVELIGDDIIVDPSRFAQRRAIDGGQLLRLRLGPGKVARHACRARVAQLAAQCRARSGVEPQPGRAFRRIRQPVVEELVQHRAEPRIGVARLGKGVGSGGGDGGRAAGGKKLASVHDYGLQDKGEGA